MNGLPVILLQSLIGTDQQTRGWMARARTPKTRAEIWRWSRWEAVSACLLLVSAFGIPLIGVSLAVWHIIYRHAPWLWWLFGSLGAAAVFLVAGSWLGSHANRRRLTALYADGHVTVGRLDEVITHPGDGDEQTTYRFLFSAELPDGVILHRRLFWGEDNSLISPQRWVGRSIQFRHNTLDPADLYDVRFDSWANGGERRNS